MSMRATGWQQSLCIWLSALMLFASMAPGFSRMLDAGLFSVASVASVEYCGDAERASHAHHAQQADHSGQSGHQTGSPEHADGIHCPFCLLFQHVPIIGTGHAAAIVPLAGAIVDSVLFPAFSLPPDGARRWLQWQKHSPPLP